VEKLRSSIAEMKHEVAHRTAEMALGVSPGMCAWRHRV
jgi:hypothetical protein